METYSKQVDIRWSDLDPNFHLRHSVYYDWGAFVRISFLNEHGLTPHVLLQHSIGPILFREECIFKREIQFTDRIDVNLQLLKSRPDMSRWTMQHEVWKNGDTLSAIITIDGAWIHTTARKLATPPALVMQGFEAIPKAPDFQWA
ncbi:acyl-CoA thioesterase [Foetidibacter luteolus]|uniref:acyl-CoA thioesterase n=1 Tax=Foetidibacter luteolus TaxID=2608880 RepID=UPI00129BB9F3|nr:acyl-CoA thioesterase [Foetidibacter luteolus]